MAWEFHGKDFQYAPDIRIGLAVPWDKSALYNSAPHALVQHFNAIVTSLLLHVMWARLDTPSRIWPGPCLTAIVTGKTPIRQRLTESSISLVGVSSCQIQKMYESQLLVDENRAWLKWGYGLKVFRELTSARCFTAINRLQGNDIRIRVMASLMSMWLYCLFTSHSIFSPLVHYLVPQSLLTSLYQHAKMAQVFQTFREIPVGLHVLIPEGHYVLY